MEKYFKDLLERFYQADSDTVKNKIYDEMLEYADSYHPGYECYDMDMYVALYKCAKTKKQRRHALGHIQDIIIDDAFQFTDEIIENFKEFVLMAEFLDENDEEEFDSLCNQVLNFFAKRKKESEFEAFAGQAGFIPEVSVWKSNSQLEEVAEIIVGINMHNESYRKALLILGF